MQYIFQDLMKLPLQERISIVERVINSLVQPNSEHQLIAMINEKIRSQKQEILEEK